MYEDEGDLILGMVDGIVDNIMLLCFDEIEVCDIVDVMIVGCLF